MTSICADTRTACRLCLKAEEERKYKGKKLRKEGKVKEKGEKRAGKRRIVLDTSVRVRSMDKKLKGKTLCHEQKKGGEIVYNRKSVLFLARGKYQQKQI